MSERFHIIIAGENGRSIALQFSRKFVLLTTTGTLVALLGICLLGYISGDSYFSSKHLSRKVDTLQTRLSEQEQAAALYLDQIELLKTSSSNEIATLKQDYEYRLNNQKARFDLETTNLQLENVKLMNTAVSDLNARSELIESVMDTIGLEVKTAQLASSANSGGPFIPAEETPYNELMKKVDDYLLAIKTMPLGKPVSGPISSRFGNRSDPLNQKSGFHEGVDIRGTRGAKIRATASGKVLKAFKNGGYGNYVEIDHGNGYHTVYAHMQKYLVKKGALVEQGQVIGNVGSTGRSTGPHLHYEIRLNKKPIDPKKFMTIADLSTTINAVTSN